MRREEMIGEDRTRKSKKGRGKRRGNEKRGNRKGVKEEK